MYIYIYNIDVLSIFPSFSGSAAPNSLHEAPDPPDPEPEEDVAKIYMEKEALRNCPADDWENRHRKNHKIFGCFFLVTMRFPGKKSSTSIH